MKLSDYLHVNGITLAKFGAMIGRSNASVSRIARGLQWPDRATVDKIAEVTNGEVTALDFTSAGSEAA